MSATVDLADAGSIAKRRAFPIFFNMGIERADGNFHNIPKPAAQPYAKIVR